MSSLTRAEARSGALAHGWALAESKPFLRQELVGPAFALIEIAALTSAAFLGGAAHHLFVIEDAVFDPHPFLAIGLVMAGLYVTLLRPHGLYRLEKLAGGSGHMLRPAATWVLVFLFFAAFAFSLKIGAQFSRGVMLSFFFLGLCTTAGLRWAAAVTLSRAIAAGRVHGRRVVFLGDVAGWAASGGPVALAGQGARAQAVFDLASGDDDDERMEQLNATLGDLLAYARTHQVDEIVVALPWPDERFVLRALEVMRVLPLPVFLVPDTNTCRLLNQPVVRMGEVCAVEVQRGPLTGYERSVKRAFDVAVALTALLALAPLFALLAAMIKLDSKGPVFFRQTRVGFSGRTFRIFKFRSMTTLEDGGSVRQATRGDMRVTQLGRFLRASSLDELPQLINVLLGQMSLVGPRPHALAHDDQYAKLIATYAYRHHVKPGITGWAQVHGHRGETPTVDAMERRVEHDLWYIANWSFWLDIRTMAMTVTELVRSRNAY